MSQPIYQTPKEDRFKINRWDAVAFIIIFGLLAMLAFVANRMTAPYNLGQPIPISLEIKQLPVYALHTVLRMFIALFFSLLFTFIIAPLAAKNRQAEKLIIPLIDILQSIPILGILSITVVGFIQLFPGSLLGPESAAIFAIFTSQVWNMTLSLYQSIKSVPRELHETAAVFHLSAWQRFWRIEVPHAIPSLLWNTMISMSAGWFFVVASEAISVSNQQIMLPGIGSYIALAILKSDLNAIFYAIFTMFIVIVIYDQLLFRPLLSWAERFNVQETDEASHRSWFYELLLKTGLKKFFHDATEQFLHYFLNPAVVIKSTLPIFSYVGNRLSDSTPNKFIKHTSRNKSTRDNSNSRLQKQNPMYYISYKNFLNPFFISLWNIVLIFGVLAVGYFLWQFIAESITVTEIFHVLYLGAITTFKVTLLIIIASLIWVPIGVWIGLHPNAQKILQPITQFLAAFPINLVYPLVVTVIIYFNLNVEIWSTPLMILGTQWYILFNVIAGTRAIPRDLKLVCQNFGLGQWLWWKRLVLPAIFPYYITGAMIAAAGCWNASIVADVLEWGNHKLVATGLGSYFSQYTTVGDFPRIALGIAVMCCYVTVINRLVWHKLYLYGLKRFTLD